MSDITVYRARPIEGESKYPVEGILYVAPSLTSAIYWGGIVADGDYYYIEELQLPPDTEASFDYNGWFDGGGTGRESTMPLSQIMQYPLTRTSQIWVNVENTRYPSEIIGMGEGNEIVLENVSELDELKTIAQTVMSEMRSLNGWLAGAYQNMLTNPYIKDEPHEFHTIHAMLELYDMGVNEDKLNSLIKQLNSIAINESSSLGEIIQRYKSLLGNLVYTTTNYRKEEPRIRDMFQTMWTLLVADERKQNLIDTWYESSTFEKYANMSAEYESKFHQIVSLLKDLTSEFKTMLP